MLLKLLTVIGVAIALWGFANRLMGAATPPAAPRGGGATDLVRCARCGSWRAPDTPCACEIPPTP